MKYLGPESEESNKVAKIILNYDGKGRRFGKRVIEVLNGKEVLIGRSNDVNVLVQSDNGIFDCRVLSRYLAVNKFHRKMGRYLNNDVKNIRKHAHLWFEEGAGFFVRDLMSSNGTFVNGSRIAQGTAKQITSGDIIQFGQNVCDAATNERHECIVAKLELIGNSEVDEENVKDLDNDDDTLSQKDAEELKKCLEDMGEREKEIEQKMAKVGIVLDHLKQKVKEGWHAMIEEDALISKIEDLESDKKRIETPSLQKLTPESEAVAARFDGQSELTEKIEVLEEKIEILGKRTDLCINLQKSTNNAIIYLSLFIVMLFLYFLIRESLKVKTCLHVW